ncbi:MAG: hypothetical protein GX974_03220 [Clostridiales bacterium]|nr:hypothetical protein [Clostridiales bacterium]
MKFSILFGVFSFSIMIICSIIYYYLSKQRLVEKPGGIIGWTLAMLGFIIAMGTYLLPGSIHGFDIIYWLLLGRILNLLIIIAVPIIMSIVLTMYLKDLRCIAMAFLGTIISYGGSVASFLLLLKIFDI